MRGNSELTVIVMHRKTLDHRLQSGSLLATTNSCFFQFDVSITDCRLLITGHGSGHKAAKLAGAFTAKVKQLNEPYELYKLKQPTNPMDSSNFTGHTNKCV